MSTTAIDTNGTTLQEGDRVWVNVGSGSILRPGTVDAITKTAVLVTFTWANGRTTIGRRFKFWTRDIRPEYAGHAVKREQS